MPTTALIDGDIVAYRASAAFNNAETEGLACWAVEKTISDILYKTDVENYLIFIGGNNNFRKVIDPEYKAHRTKPKPQHLPMVELFLQQHYGAIRIHGLETDDALGILQQERSIICSIDKDLLQVPGLHYNWVTNSFTEVSDLEGIKQFYSQLLIGDVADNIKGIKGVGKVKAEKLLRDIDDPDDMFNIVRKEYDNDLRMERNCHLLWILKSQNFWTHDDMNTLKPNPEVRLDYILETETGYDLFTEHGMKNLKIDGILPHG